MASFMTKMKTMKVGSGVHGAAGVLLDGGVGFGASYALG